MLRRATACAALILIVSSVAACSPAEPPAPHKTTQTAAPVFASDEQALGAATSIYGEYLAARNVIENEGGVGIERLEPYTSPTVAAQTSEFATDFLVAFEMHAEGAVTFDSTTLVRRDDRPRADGAVMAVTLCEDESARTVVRADGVTAVRNGGATRYGYEVTIAVEPAEQPDAAASRIVSREPVDDPALCG